MLSGEFGMGLVENPVCTLSVRTSDALKLLSGELSWLDALDYGKFTYKGDLTAALWLRDIRTKLSL